MPLASVTALRLSTRAAGGTRGLERVFFPLRIHFDILFPTGVAREAGVSEGLPVEGEGARGTVVYHHIVKTVPKGTEERKNAIHSRKPYR